ncbi:hypothetical protein Gpo141_00014347 [Globisporangium polare]
MASRQTIRVAVVLTVLAVVGCVALMSFESEFLSERLVYFQRQEPATTASSESSQVAHATLRTEESSVRAASRATEGSSTGDGTAVGETSATVLVEQSVNKTTTAPGERASEQSAQTNAPHLDDLDELMTPEMIKKIETQRVDPLSPVQVHLVWIGDISKAPKGRQVYIDKGYQLTVHSDPEAILDGFHPYVLKAYHQAIPTVVGYDFLKFALLYKHGGFAVDADTSPAIPASEIKFPSECDVIFGKEAVASNWDKPVFRDTGGPTYGLNRPFQILNWAMAASRPRNRHIKYMLKAAMMHFFGLRDMEGDLIQDISGSGLMTDYVALLHEKEGRNYRDVYLDRSKIVPVEGLCMTDGQLRGGWIDHHFLGSWKKPGVP